MTVELEIVNLPSGTAGANVGKTAFDLPAYLETDVWYPIELPSAGSSRTGLVASTEEVIKETVVDQPTDLIVHPNPNTGTFEIAFYKEADGLVSVAFISLAGVLGYQGIQEAVAGSNSIEVDLPANIAPGVYLIQVNDAVKARSAKIIEKR